MEIDYESILGKAELSLDIPSNVNRSFESERVLVTGAGGSIGSQIAIRLASIPNLQLFATDRDENRLHSLSLKIEGSALFNSTVYNVLDIRDRQGVENVFAGFKPTLVVHAAALKHLALLEKQPREAYLTNVLGTQNLLDAAQNSAVQKFLNISTDKAARPVSILGKTKYITEVMTACARKAGFGGYTSVRFGNVFNSKGSVIETFVNQIQQNRPVTITDTRVTRYFMKISEAANLSLTSSILNAGDVHILKMGEPILLMDVVKQLAKFLGKEYSTIQVGLREGEKLHEELYAPDEELFETEHEQVTFLNLNFHTDASLRLERAVTSDREALLSIDGYLRALNA